MTINIGVADDEQLFLKSLGRLIDGFPSCATIIEAMSGEDLLKKLASGQQQPDILLLDVRMRGMSGIQTATILTKEYPLIRLAALSTQDDDNTIISMLKAGACAYLLKDIHPDELERALLEIYSHGFYNGDAYNVNCRRLIRHSERQAAVSLNEREKTFLRLSCSDLTYKQIAAEMHLSERTIDGYREVIFEKFNVQSRVGMVLEALRRKIVSL